MDFVTENPRSLNLSSSMELNRLLKFCEPPFLFLDNGDGICHIIDSVNEIRNIKA